MLNRDKLIHEAESIVDTVIKKNKDYGSSYNATRNKFGDVAFLIRVSDKYYRLANLLGTNSLPMEVIDEKIEDTIRDIIGYCLLELNYRNEDM